VGGGIPIRRSSVEIISSFPSFNSSTPVDVDFPWADTEADRYDRDVVSYLCREWDVVTRNYVAVQTG